MKEQKDYFILADYQPAATSVDRIREFLKWSQENGFTYRHRSLNSSTKKLQVKRGYIYSTCLLDGAPYYDVLYRNRNGVVYYRIWENESYNHNVARRLLYAFKHYTIDRTYRSDYTVGTVREALEG